VQFEHQVELITSFSCPTVEEKQCLSFSLGRIPGSSDKSWYRSEGVDTEYFISDVYGEVVMADDRMCDSSLYRQQCVVCLLDGEYIWRVMDALIPGTSSGVIWQFCDQYGGMQTQLEFQVEDGKCNPGSMRRSLEICEDNMNDCHPMYMLQGVLQLQGLDTMELTDDDVEALQDTITLELNEAIGTSTHTLSASLFLYWMFITLTRIRTRILLQDHIFRW
jgi:hypothetical protein